VTKDVIEAIMERRTVRKFKDQPVPEPTIGRLLDAARMAPSAGNVQAWHFFVVLNSDYRQRLQEACLGQPSVGMAPMAIVVCTVPDLISKRYGERGKYLYSIQETAAAVQNLMLAAQGYGLATCWIGAFNEEQVKKAVDIDEAYRPVAVVLAGYTEGEVKAPPKKALQDVTTIIK